MKKNTPTAHFTPTPPMLVNEISRLFHARMRADDPGGLISQDSTRLIMRALAREDGCSQLDLVRKTHLKPPTVSVTLKRLETDGLVKRQPDPMDLRITRVYLSPKGQEHNRRVLSRLRETDAELMQGFSEEEKKTLCLLLDRMYENLRGEK